MPLANIIKKISLEKSKGSYLDEAKLSQVVPQYMSASVPKSRLLAI